MTAGIRWVGGPKLQYAAYIPPERWNLYKSTILEKYAHMTLKELKHWMEIEYNFYASRSQYLHQLGLWGIRKAQNGEVVMLPSPITTSGNSDTTSPMASTRLNESSTEQPSPETVNFDLDYDSLELRLPEVDFSTLMNSYGGPFDPIPGAHLISTSRETAARLLVRMGVHEVALQLFERGWKDAKGHLPLNPKILLAFATYKSSRRGFHDLVLGLDPTVSDLLDWTQYGPRSQTDQIVHLLKEAFHLDLDMMPLKRLNPSLIPNAIAQLSKTDRSLDFLVYQSANRLLKSQEILQDMRLSDILDIGDPQPMETDCNQQAMLHLKKTFLELRPGPFELNYDVLQNDCLKFFFQWCRTRVRDAACRMELDSVALKEIAWPPSRSELYLFCFLWEQWFSNPGGMVLIPHIRMGLTREDLIDTICCMVHSAGKDTIPEITANPKSHRPFMAAISSIMDTLLQKTDVEFASDFLDAFMLRTELENRRYDEESSGLNPKLDDVTMLLVRTYVLAPVEKILTRLRAGSNDSDDTAVAVADCETRPNSRRSMVSQSTSASFASMRRMEARIREQSRLSVSSNGVGSSIVDYMSIVSERLSILSCTSDELPFTEQEEIDSAASNGGSTLVMSGRELIGTTRFQLGEVL